MQTAPSRNAPCPCGSGKKYKRCCGQGASGKPAAAPASDQLQQLLMLYQQGNMQAAAHLAKQLLQRQPDDTSLLEIAGVVALQLGDVEQAVTHLGKQTRLQPDNALAFSNLCMALHTLGQDEEAFQAGQTAIKLEPKLADAWNNLGNIYKSGNHLEGALEHYEKALALDGKDPRVHINAGSVSQLLGDLDTAKKRYKAALKLYPDFAPAWNNLGTVAQRQRQHQEAEEYFQRALKLQPDNPETLTNLASLWLDQDDTDRALKALEGISRDYPDHVGAWVNLGTLHEKKNDSEAARHCYDKALLLDPDNTTVHCNLGYSHFELGDQQPAIEHFIRALKSDPNSAKALAGLGKTMLRQDDIDKAREYIDKARKIAPWDPYVLIAMAQLDTDTRKYEAAEQAWHKAIELHPGMSEGHIGLARMYSDMNRPDDSRAQFRRAEQTGAADLALYHAWSSIEEKNNRLDVAERLAETAVAFDRNYPGLAILRSKLARRRGDFATALELLEQVDIKDIRYKEVKASYLFELGNVNDKLGNYPAAFAAYDEANRTKNEYVGHSYNYEADRRKFAGWKALFTTANWSRLRSIPLDDSNTRPRPVFIVGFPRSGTSLLEQILGSHPQFAPAGELLWIPELAGNEGQEIIGSEKDYPDMLLDPDAPLNADKLQAMREYYLDKINEPGIIDADTGWVTDKLPHNAIHLGLIALLFPESPIIHISRHPLNSCLSAYFSNFSSVHRYTSSLASTAQHYAQVMGMLDHYRSLPGLKYLEMHYEDLVENQEATTRQVLEFIGAPWDNACLEHHKSTRVVRTASYEQVTQKVYRSSLHRYRNYADAVKPVIPLLEPVLQRFGYSTD
ncbi:MAG: tetratricopeptide repeat protein [Pseudomonadota bacterium]